MCTNLIKVTVFVLHTQYFSLDFIIYECLKLVSFGAFVSSGWYCRVHVKDCCILVILLEKNSAKPSAISSLILVGGSGLWVLHPVRLFTILNSSFVFLLLSIICLVTICFFCGISVVHCTCFFQWCRPSSANPLCVFCRFDPCF